MRVRPRNLFVAAALGLVLAACAQDAPRPSRLLVGEQSSTPAVGGDATEPTLAPVLQEIGPDEIRLPGRAVGGAAAGRPGQIGRLSIPRIGLDTAVFSGREELMNNGPLHWYASALPGRPGNAVFSGHRTTHTHPFRMLHLLSSGDKVSYTMPGGVFTYLVYRVFVVKLDDYSILEHGDESITTLFACHPPGDNQHWIVAQARLVGTRSPEPSAKSSPKPTTAPTPPSRPERTPRPLPTPSLLPVG